MEYTHAHKEPKTAAENVDTVINDIFDLANDFHSISKGFASHADRLAGSRPTAVAGKSGDKPGAIETSVLSRLRALRSHLQSIRSDFNEISQRFVEQI